MAVQNIICPNCARVGMVYDSFRAIWFFTPSNPKLTFGGMEGEPKKEMHDLLPPHLCPAFFNIQPSDDFTDILKKLTEKENTISAYRET